MEKQFSTLWQPAFPNVPLQTNLGTPILQPGISKYEFITLEIFKELIKKSSDFAICFRTAKEQAKQFVEAFDREAETALKVEQEKLLLKL